MLIEPMKETGKDQIVIFVHLPKTAGTTLRYIIERNFDKKTIFTIDGKDSQKSINLFNSLGSSDKASFSLIEGHLEFGAIKYLPHKKIKYITFVRDPVERVLSYYSYILSDSYRRPWAKNAESMSLKNYLLSRQDGSIDNHQTRWIAGNVKWEYGACNEEALERAKNNIINHFHFVGITEQFDRSILLMSKLLGWRTPYYKKLNITKKRITQGTIGDEEKSLIMEENKFDVQLYKFIQSRFEQQMRSSFSHLQVKLFQIMNKIRANN